MAVEDVLHPAGRTGRFAEPVGRLSGEHPGLVAGPEREGVLYLGGGAVEHRGDVVGGARSPGGDVPEALDHERGGVGGPPVEVVVADVHEPGVRRQRDPQPVTLGATEDDVDVVALTETEVARRHLDGHARSPLWAAPRFTWRTNSSQPAHVAADAVGGVTRDCRPSGHLVGVGPAPLVDRVAAAEEDGSVGVGVAEGVGGPARQLVGQVVQALGGGLGVGGLAPRSPAPSAASRSQNARHTAASRHRRSIT